MNAVINPDFTLNEEAWERQGPLLLTVSPFSPSATKLAC
jgi:hypothetical protein